MGLDVGDFAGYWKAFSHNLNGPQPSFLGTLDGLLSECFEKLEPEGQGFVAQIGLRPDFPLPLTDLSYGNSFGYAKCCESV